MIDSPLPNHGEDGKALAPADAKKLPIGPVEEPGRRKTVIVTGLVALAVLFFFDDLVGWINGGGLLSVASAYRSIDAHAAVIDIDGAGLRTAFIIPCVIVTVLLFLALRWRIDDGWRSFLFIMLIVGGGFILDAIFDEDAVSGRLEASGYRRCAARDHSVGSGKGRKWFNNYAFTAADCVSKSAGWQAPKSDGRTQLPRPAQPIGSVADWFSDDDYPEEAMSQNEEGTVRVRFLIDAKGWLRECRVTSSSGYPLLDAQTCEIIISNARYWPARNRTGKAIAQEETQAVSWRIPHD